LVFSPSGIICFVSLVKYFPSIEFLVIESNFDLLCPFFMTYSVLTWNEDLFKHDFLDDFNFGFYSTSMIPDSSSINVLFLNYTSLSLKVRFDPTYEGMIRPSTFLIFSINFFCCCLYCGSIFSTQKTWESLFFKMLFPRTGLALIVWTITGVSSSF